MGWAVTRLEEKGMKSAREQKGTELELCKDSVEYKTAFFTHPAVDLVERSPTLLFTLTIAD
jgi:hypothetical protein